ncbi:DUF4167 domain-containing protein [Leptospira interrogans]
MRQGQQNRRGRGRNRNGGGGGKSHHNPLTRSFESNGPDVKIRGTPSHIAEKYMSLARDAQSSGDPVLAENYLQHAEHYNRIIMAFREQTMQQSGENVNGNGRHREAGEGEEFGDDEGDDVEAGSFNPQVRGHEPQPRPSEHSRYEDRPQRYSGDRHSGDRDRDRPHRQYNDRGGRERYQDRSGQNGERHAERPAQQVQPQAQPQPSEQPVVEAQPAPARTDTPPRRRERFAASNHEQPEFLRRPVRRPRREAAASEDTAVANGAAADDGDAEKSA